MNDIEYTEWCQKEAKRLLKEQEKKAIIEFNESVEYQEQKEKMLNEAHYDTLTETEKAEIDYYNGLVIKKET